MKKLIILLFCLLCQNVFGQSFSIFDIDTTNFPTIKAKFYAFDTQGIQITNLNNSDFEVKDKGIARNDIGVSCPTPQLTKTLSLPVNTYSFYKEMALIPAGIFQMGNTGENLGDSDERPIHRVILSHDLLMSKHEITQRLYEDVMGVNPSNFKGENLPVEMVTWYNAVEFCNKLSEIEGLEKCYSGTSTNIVCDWEANGYRLPTEAEWEYACKAETTTDFHSGNLTNEGCSPIDVNLDLIGWYCGNASNKTHVVGQKAPNSFGLYDMIGNVWEWCWDWYNSYNSTVITDPKGASYGINRVLHGGSFLSQSIGCRSSNRGYDNRAYFQYGLDCGFRIVSNNTRIIDHANISTHMTVVSDIICSKIGYSNLIITNTGGDTLKIASIISNSTEFIINEVTQINLAPDSTKTINMTFKPTSIGLKTADIVIKSNANPDSVKTILVSARKDSVALIPQLSVIDLGYLCPNESKDTLLTISNMGTIKSGGKVELSNLLSSSNKEFSLNPSSNHVLNISFPGQANEGLINEKISVYDLLCGYSRDISVIGKVEKLVIQATDLSLNVLLGQSIEGIITIKNISNRPIEIKSISGINNPFALIKNQLPIIIAAGNSADIKISYTPTDTTQVLNNIIINTEPCTINTKAILTGTTIKSTASATLQAMNKEALIGDEIEIPIILNKQVNLSIANVSSLKIDLSFNPTLLYPLNYSVQKIDDKTAKITIDNLPINVAAGQPIAKIKFKAGLGNAEECDLTLSNAITNGGKAELTLINGKFTLLGICKEGGTRLVNPNALVGIQSISPNPAKEKINIRAKIVENGTKIRVLNSAGLLVKEYTFNTDKTKEKDLQIDSSEMTNGVYFIEFKSSTFSQTEKIMIEK